MGSRLLFADINLQVKVKESDRVLVLFFFFFVYARFPTRSLSLPSRPTRKVLLLTPSQLPPVSAGLGPPAKTGVPSNFWLVIQAFFKPDPPGPCGEESSNLCIIKWSRDAICRQASEECRGWAVGPGAGSVSGCSVAESAVADPALRGPSARPQSFDLRSPAGCPARLGVDAGIVAARLPAAPRSHPAATRDSSCGCARRGRDAAPLFGAGRPAPDAPPAGRARNVLGAGRRRGWREGRPPTSTTQPAAWASG